jgi:hypothetical protein
VSILDLNSHTLGSNEEVTKISVLDLSIGGSVEKFIVVGTAIWEDDGNEPSKGKILLFKAQMGRARPAVANPAIPTLTLAMDAEISGSVVALGEVGGYLAVLVNTVVSTLSSQKVFYSRIGFWDIACWTFKVDRVSGSEKRKYKGHGSSATRSMGA